ncbi:hypothetical protein B0H13DRAFT_1988652 [Mycena leptocephala]|nr:hypothetical protein B0H13DRAFT_1988652 [Mycena leptocephala]
MFPFPRWPSYMLLFVSLVVDAGVLHCCHPTWFLQRPRSRTPCAAVHIPSTACHVNAAHSRDLLVRSPLRLRS